MVLCAVGEIIYIQEYIKKHIDKLFYYTLVPFEFCMLITIKTGRYGLIGCERKNISFSIVKKKHIFFVCIYFVSNYILKLWMKRVFYICKLCVNLVLSFT